MSEQELGGLESTPNIAAGASVISTNAEDDDATLARRAAAGDGLAFGALYDRHFDAVYRYVVVRVADRMEAEDVTSEVFVRVMRALHRYEPRSAFRAWLYRIARNAVVDRARRKPVYSLDADPELRRRHSASEADPAERSVAADEARRVRAALATLSELQREVITLRFFDGLSTGEICAVLGKGQSTVRGIQFRALQKLREVLPRPEAT